MNRGLCLIVASMLALAPGCRPDPPAVDVSVVSTHQAALAVATVWPPANSTDVPKDVSPAIGFDAFINLSSFTAATVPVFGSMSGHHSALYSAPGGDTLIIAPEQAFMPGERVAITVTTDVRDMATQRLWQPFVWEFIVAGGTAPADFGAYAAFGAGGEASMTVAVADLDRDGKLDLVVGRNGQDGYYKGTGGGLDNTAYPLGPQTGITMAIAIGDFDRDGFPDIVTAGNMTEVTVFPNNGVGGFSSANSTGLSLTRKVSGLAVGDINNDGWLDLVVAVDSTTQPSVIFFNDGNGDLSGSHTPVSTVALPTLDVALGDVRNDGDLDIFLANFGAQDFIVENLGDGILSTSATPFGRSTTRSTCIVVADISGDGHVDSIIGVDGGPPEVFPGSATGIFISASPEIGSTSGSTWSLALGDLDGDGDLDLVEANNDRASRYYLYNVGFDSGSTLTPGASANRAVAIGDMDEDGDLDIATVFNPSTVDSVYLNALITADSCGDGGCTGNETWTDCPQDCPAPVPTIDSVYANPSSVDVDGNNYTTIYCDFSDDNVMSQDDLLITIEVNPQASGIPVLLCDNATLSDDCDGPLGATAFNIGIHANGQGSHEASVVWTPAVGVLLGPYDLSCTVRNVRTSQSAMSDFVDNPGALTLADDASCVTFDLICDGLDEDCSGSADEDFIPVQTECGVGACASVGWLTCVSGVEDDSCWPGTPLSSDIDCNGIDDDCNGEADDGYAGAPSSCGVGACYAAGVMSCIGGNELDSCVPGPAAADDVNCDDVDDDCNGTADDGFVGTPVYCGVGACRTSGTTVCDVGVQQENCTPIMPTENVDVVCDGIDEDCDGTADEDANDSSSCNGMDAQLCYVAQCVSGACSFTRDPTCCTDNSDCASSSCSTGVCTNEICTQEPVAGCCETADDCNDGDPCTVKQCNVDRGECVYEDVPDCCATDAACDDGDSCTADVCSPSVNRCKQRATCGQDSPCGDDPTCWYSALWVDPGRAGLDVVLDDSAEEPVLQLIFTTDAVGGELDRLKLTTDVVPPAGIELQLAIYVDADGDGTVDAGAQPLAVATPSADSRGEIIFSDMSLSIGRASSATLLVTAQRVEATAALPVAGAVRWGSVLSLLLLGLLLAVPRQRMRLGFAALLLVGFGACTFNLKVVPLGPGLGHVRLQSAEQVDFIAEGSDAVQVVAPVIESVSIELPN